MHPESLIPIFVLFCIAGGVSYLILRVTKVEVTKDKWASIDGLRGVLAFSVFIHHSAVWFYFLRTFQWAPPPSYVYSHFGPSSVAMFFMITAFLFYSKLLDARQKGMDWVKLYVSRLYRILPLYLFALPLAFLAAFAVGGFTLHEPISQVVWEFIQWLLYMEPNINGLGGSKILVAGVVWSLAFEWLFYCSLAIIGWAVFRIRTSVVILITTAFFFALFLYIILYFYPYGVIRRLCPFGGGIAAAVLVRDARVRKFCSTDWVSGSLVLIIPSILLFYPDVATPVPFLGICVAFIAIAAGNDLFGLLTHRLMRYLGMISYSIYLLHGLILFAVFRFIIGFEKARSLTVMGHWAIIGCCSILLILVSTLTYFFIEKAAQRKKKAAAKNSATKIPAV